MEPHRLIPPRVRLTSVLVVDDDQGVRLLLHRWLDDAGYEVHDADDALRAMDVVRSTRIDAVISDIRMPGPNGVWLIEQITQEYPETPIIVVTGLPEMDPAVTLRPGVVRYLTKPFERDTVLSAVGEALETRESLTRDAPRARPRLPLQP